MEEDARFTLEAKPEFWEEQATWLATFIRVLGLFVSLIFSVGAVLGAAGGVLGGLLPALRASRLSILDALRA